MKKGWTITQESFDQLLNWLDEDIEKAGQKYQQIRERLIKMFISRGFSDAEDLADETFNRVISKIVEIAPKYSGERAYYFYNVASKIVLEANRRKQAELNEATTKAISATELNPKLECLDECLKKLPNEQHRLVMTYYEVEKESKVNKRIALAESLNLNLNSLRVQVSRIRTTLKNCVEECSA